MVVADNAAVAADTTVAAVVVAPVDRVTRLADAHGTDAATGAGAVAAAGAEAAAAAVVAVGVAVAAVVVCKLPAHCAAREA